ncbi:SecDF P1 head subdomain-containing protein, partial [Salmonella enterica]|uniref:SecDF P1 head subdomain-containing protein n=1 Tax=Salmonella enterica TaxID=28901 RepID=UPI00398C4DA3
MDNGTADGAGRDIRSTLAKENMGKPRAKLVVGEKASVRNDVTGGAVLVKQEDVINIANIQSRLGNSFRITGISNPNEARQPPLLLRACALMYRIPLVDERPVGPLVGGHNLKQGPETSLAASVASLAA